MALTERYIEEWYATRVGAPRDLMKISENHYHRNKSTRNAWELMSPHRARVTQLVIAAHKGKAKSLCVLGAGNSNDLDLAQIAELFERIVLIDLDEHALIQGVQRVQAHHRTRIECLGGLDITGILPELERLQSVGSNDMQVTAMKKAQIAPKPLNDAFDVVVSSCVLSQLIDSIVMAAPPSPLLDALILTVRNRHLEIMIELLASKGHGILVTDFVSSQTASEINSISDTKFPTAAIEWIKQRNFFTGTNPTPFTIN